MIDPLMLPAIKSDLESLERLAASLHDAHQSEFDTLNDVAAEIRLAVMDIQNLQDATQRLDYSQGRTPPSTHLASSSQELINQALKQLDLRPCDLAEKLGVSRGQISKWKKHNEYMSVSRQTMIKELMQ